MPLNFVNISNDPYLQWGTVLEHVADCIKLQIDTTTTGARVYPYWVYEIDANTLLGTIVPQMLAQGGTSDGKVHCWTIGIQSATPRVNQQGDNPIVGDRGRQNEWILMLDIWGLHNYSGTKQSQQAFLNEVRLVGAGLSRNTDVFVSEVPEISFAGRPQFTSLQPTPFSDSKNYSVAVGVMQINVSEALIS